MRGRRRLHGICEPVADGRRRVALDPRRAPGPDRVAGRRRGAAGGAARACAACRSCWRLAWPRAASRRCSPSGPTTPTACSGRRFSYLRRLRLGRADRLVALRAARSSAPCCGSWRRRWRSGRSARSSSSSSASSTAAPTSRWRSAMTRFSAPAAGRQRPARTSSPNGSSSTATAARRRSTRRLAVQRPAAAADRLRCCPSAPFGWDDERARTTRCSAVVLQQLWIVGLWALLLAARVGRADPGAGDGRGAGQRPRDRQRLLRLAEAAAGGDAAGRRGAGADAALGASCGAASGRRRWSRRCCALAMLGHGSSVFGVIPLVARRRLPRPAELALARRRRSRSGSS